ncbi:CoA transferase subunit A [Oceanicella actignis]|uniref:Glutaconate CoA-transferase subunit A n=1 Tax=Oceanicella actignis TaxID=1189325 RepID=A0A1M7SUJ3_9RHOB|nr:CoA-transferase [Oceanicella actignis]TYO90663.1 glutaconate CoA-transferase subunit A [Oceanicella actignis]SES71346.1 glutaconate CoA-transferase subunit A [Oceanicella actignis]SHN62132.1 glutaconate CoA-transferase subunit A [Oceanicella actignis]
MPSQPPRLEPDADALARLAPDGASVAIAKDPGAPMALTRALIRRGARGLRLVTVPTGAMAADMLIGAGCVARIETAGVSLGEFGPAARFADAVRAGAVEIRDATCPAVYAALQAGEKGQPFATIRGIIGSDLMRARPDWKVIDNPFAPGDRVVALPPLRPDLALMHVALADRRGNLWVGGRHELKTMAHAAHATLATAERIVEGDLAADPALAPNLIGGIYVAALAEAPRGAWPTAMPGAYARDDAHHRLYAAAARRADSFADYLRRFVLPREQAA